MYTFAPVNKFWDAMAEQQGGAAQDPAASTLTVRGEKPLFQADPSPFCCQQVRELLPRLCPLLFLICLGLGLLALGLGLGFLRSWRSLSPRDTTPTTAQVTQAVPLIIV